MAQSTLLQRLGRFEQLYYVVALDFLIVLPVISCSSWTDEAIRARTSERTSSEVFGAAQLDRAPSSLHAALGVVSRLFQSLCAATISRTIKERVMVNGKTTTLQSIPEIPPGSASPGIRTVILTHIAHIFPIGRGLEGGSRTSLSDGVLRLHEGLASTLHAWNFVLRGVTSKATSVCDVSA